MVLQILVVAALGVVCVGFTSLNWLLAIRFWLYRKPSSFAPLVGGVFGAVALTLFPWPEVRRYWWVPTVADIGCAPMLVAALFDVVVRLAWHSKRK